MAIQILNKKNGTVLLTVDSNTLFGADLAWASLSGADLTYAELTRAHLMGADLSGADLRMADLAGADLSEAELSEADLTHADLTGANLKDVNFAFADLTGVRIDDADKIQVPNLYSKLLAAVNGGKNLDMDVWHHPCGDSHCLAGWAVALAGEKGWELEGEYGTEAAAALILIANDSNLVMPNFRGEKQEAMEWLREKVGAANKGL